VQSDYFIGGIGVDVFAELFQHFDSGADLSCRWWLHGQMRMPREGLWRIVAGGLAAVWEATAPAALLLK
jgi:hypothetical protein